MKTLSAESFVPKTSSFKLASNNKEYQLRAVTLDDELWIQDTFKQNIGDLIAKTDMSAITRVVYHLIVDKSDFKNTTVTIMNEEGESKTQALGGVKLFRYMINGGPNEQIEIIKALLETIGFSRPMQEEYTEKKRTALLENKENMSQTGPSSLTASVQSTDGQPSTSSQEPQEKLQCG